MPASTGEVPDWVDFCWPLGRRDGEDRSQQTKLAWRVDLIETNLKDSDKTGLGQWPLINPINHYKDSEHWLVSQNISLDILILSILR